MGRTLVTFNIDSELAASFREDVIERWLEQDEDIGIADTYELDA